MNSTRSIRISAVPPRQVYTYLHTVVNANPDRISVVTFVILYESLMRLQRNCIKYSAGKFATSERKRDDARRYWFGRSAFKAVWDKGFVVSNKYEVSGRLPDRFPVGIISDGERNKYDPVSALTRTIFGSRHRIALSSLQACNLRELRATQITSVRRDDEHLCRRVYAVRQSDPSESSFSLDSRNDCDNLQ